MGHLQPPWSDQRISVNQPLNHQNVYICLYMYNHVCFSVHLCFPVRLCLRFTLSYAMCFARRPFDRWWFSDGDVRYKSGRAGAGDETKVGARLTSLLRVRRRPVAMLRMHAAECFAVAAGCASMKERADGGARSRGDDTMAGPWPRHSFHFYWHRQHIGSTVRAPRTINGRGLRLFSLAMWPRDCTATILLLYISRKNRTTIN
jgi:hypothetical protein